MSGEFEISWEDVGGMLMPAIKPEGYEFKVQVEPNHISFQYLDGTIFLSMKMEEWLKLGAAVNLVQTIMLDNTRKQLENEQKKISCSCAANGDGCCNGDCHC